MGLDFCNETQRRNLVLEINRGKNLNLEGLYTYLCPVFMFVCFCSIVFNAVLLVISRRCKTITKTSILLLSLNLALTDLIASLLNGLSLLFNSYLPEVHNRNPSQCSMLLLEVFRCAALVASALHLLALAAVHYRGIVDPLHYRSSILYSQRLSRTINMISVGCWFIPLSVIFGLYSFSPCQGFQTAECDYLFLTSFSFRYTVFTLFAVPLLLMSLIYLRIYIFINRLQKSQRANHHEQVSLSRNEASHRNTLRPEESDLPELSVLLDHRGRCPVCSLEGGPANNSSTQETSESLVEDQPEVVEKHPLASGGLEREERKETVCEIISETSPPLVDARIGNGNENGNGRLVRSCTCDKRKPVGGSSAPPKLARANTVAFGALDESSATNKRNVQKQVSIESRSSVSTTTQLNPRFSKNSLKFYLQRSKKYAGPTTIPEVSTTVCSTTDMTTNNNTTNAKNSSTYEPQRLHLHSTALPPKNAKALVTTLLILGTYFMSYLPAVAVQVLTCVDDCPYPLYVIPFWLRVLLGTMTTLLIIIKSILDPLIYTYRMKEIQEAVNKCISRRFGSRSFTGDGSQYSASQRLNNNNNNNNKNLQHQSRLDNSTRTGGSMRVFSETCSSPTATTVRSLHHPPTVSIQNSPTPGRKKKIVETPHSEPFERQQNFKP